MRTAASFGLRTPIRLAGYVLLGGLGALALVVPLAGVLGYWAALLYPLLLAWFLAGGILAITRPARQSRLYVWANLGVLVATLIVLLASWIILVTVGQLNTAVTAPAYLAIVLAGLGGGLIVGARR
jgi:hydrogenase-4 membrane subunit HyfE